jgi:hypothetical protein
VHRKPSLTDSHGAHAIRIAWWASFLATVALVAILSFARSAQAATLPAGGFLGPLAAAVPSSDDEDLEGDEEAEEAEASEDGEVEAEGCEGDEVECEEEEDAAAAPQECLLTTAAATVSVSHDKLRLLVRYTTSTAAAVAVDYGLHGGKGSLYLGGAKKRFGPEGVLRLTRQLSEAQLAKVMAARDFTVRLRVAGAPDYCRPLFDHQLDVRRATPGGLAWSQSE